MKNKKQGFTLAEVLITLGIIGVVAALTIPTLVTNNKQRSMDTAANVFTVKLGEALKIMNSQSALSGYSTTREFINELSKHIKIVKTCDSDSLVDCFASEIFTSSNSMNTLTLKKAENLNASGNYDTETIGVQFADGVSALIAYNKNATQNPYSSNNINLLTSGSGKNLQVTLLTDALTILYDVTGNAGPNVYDIDDSGQNKDIRGINVSFATGINVEVLGETYTWDDAQVACETKGKKLPNKEELLALYEKKGENGIPTSGNFWSSTEANSSNAYWVSFSSGTASSNGMKFFPYSVICVGN